LKKFILRRKKMGLRIKTNVESLVAQRHLNNNNQDAASSVEKLASGSRINKSSDDAAGLAISESIRAKTRGLNQAKRNASDGVSFLQVAESGLNEISNIMIRLRELTIQAASDTLGSQEKQFLNKEYQELSQEVDRIAASTEFNGRKLLGPQEKEYMTIQVGYSGSENDRLNIKLSEDGKGVNTESLKIRGSDINTDDYEAIATNLTNIDDGLQSISKFRAGLGASQSRLMTAINSISTTTENMMNANSRIRDVDFAEETAKFTQAKILSTTAIAILSQANQRPEMVLNLLR
jgi:flagellin